MKNIPTVEAKKLEPKNTPTKRPRISLSKSSPIIIKLIGVEPPAAMPAPAHKKSLYRKFDKS